MDITDESVINMRNKEKEAMKRIEESLKKQISKVKEYEIFELKELLINDYYTICKETVKSLVVYINKLEEYKQIRRGSSVKVLLGGYMDDFELLCEFN